MTDQHTLSSFPSRPFSLTEIDALETRNRIHSIVADDITVEDDIEPELSTVSVSSCVLITADTVTAAVYVANDAAWYRVYHAVRPDVELTAAYKAIRAFRGEDTLFAAEPLSVREAIHHTELDKKLIAGDPDYVEGDAFDCPLCEATHTVRRHDDEAAAYLVDDDRLYVDCPEAAAGTLPVY